ncbi:glycoside hydrolase family 6 protein [Amycolatopsis sp. NPDC059021]|uniref:glycoside hydrolase family 6 protein n=1 Tax=Amycolatopsis sp. NPDC059021 TaxID=3346704 RepID=UPI00367118BE
MLAVLTGCVLLAGCQEVSGDSPPNSGRPPTLFGGKGDMYVDPAGPAARWVAAHPESPDRDTIAKSIASRPAARLVTAPRAQLRGDLVSYLDGATAANEQPFLLADADSAVRCSPSPHDDRQTRLSTYREWFTELGTLIGTRSALVVVKAGRSARPGCGARIGETERIEIAKASVEQLHRSPHVLVFLDVTDLAGTSPPAAATFATSVGLGNLTGLALDVGGYQPETSAKEIRMILNRTAPHNRIFILTDSSRNGAQTDTTCNPPGAQLGTGESVGDDPANTQQLWLTTPGISDGPCGLAPDSTRGEFVPRLALALIPREK